MPVRPLIVVKATLTPVCAHWLWCRPHTDASVRPLIVVQATLTPVRALRVLQAGSIVTVKWSVRANHGGGYSYRLWPP